MLHPSASVVPAALAAAEHAGASGELTSRAIAVGIEVAVRLGMAGYDAELGNSVFFEHGQHATSITGAMGSSVATAMIYGLDAQGISDVLGITASMAAGVIEANRTGGTVKRLHCGSPPRPASPPRNWSRVASPAPRPSSRAASAACRWAASPS